jgi:NADPH-dependent glutamate synthase beta subunit-like oxidoreductase
VDGAELESNGYDAVLLAAGTARSKGLSIEGADLDGIMSGLPFLRSARDAHEPGLDAPVVVIGGGNVAVDVAMTALRLGADDVHLVCLESRGTMPAHDWEIAQAEAEGVHIHAGWGPRRFTAQGDRVAGVDMVRCTRVFDEQGAFKPVFDESQTQHLPAHHIVITIGQEVDADLFGEYPGLARSSSGTVSVDGELATATSGTFAAGDVVRGPSSVVEAMADGRRAAAAIDRYLGGEGLVDIPPAGRESTDFKLDYPSEVMHRARQPIPSPDPQIRTSGFEPIEETLRGRQAQLEAERCLRCHLRQTITVVTLPPDRWLTLDRERVESVPETEGVFQLLNSDRKVIRITGTADLRESLMQCLDEPGAARYFVWEADPMFTKRESELLQQHLQAHGELPGGGVGGDELEDLF